MPKGRGANKRKGKSPRALKHGARLSDGGGTIRLQGGGTIKAGRWLRPDEPAEEEEKQDE